MSRESVIRLSIFLTHCRFPSFMRFDKRRHVPERTLSLDHATGWRAAAPFAVRASGARAQHASERVSLERVAKFHISVEHGVGLVAAELLEAGRVDAAIMLVLSAPRFRLWPPSAAGSKPASAARATTPVKFAVLPLWTYPITSPRRGSG